MKHNGNYRTMDEDIPSAVRQLSRVGLAPERISDILIAFVKQTHRSGLGNQVCCDLCRGQWLSHWSIVTPQQKHKEGCVVRDAEVFLSNLGLFDDLKKMLITKASVLDKIKS